MRIKVTDRDHHLITQSGSEEPPTPLWWFDVAGCRGRRQLFVGHRGSSNAARSICDECPAANVCFWFAVRSEVDRGYFNDFYGGTTAAERQSFVRRHEVTRGLADVEYEREKHRLWAFLNPRNSRDTPVVG